MGIPVRFHSSASPEEVIAAIHEEAGRGRESIVPPALRSQGVRGMEAHVSGSRLTLTAAVRESSEWWPRARLRACVLPGEDGVGSVVRGECTAGSPATYVAFLWIGIALLFTSLRAWGGVILFFVIATGIAFLIDERRIERGDDEVARYLTIRLAVALDSLEGSSEDAAAGSRR